MLVRRVVTRPVNLRSHLPRQAQRQFTLPSRSQLQAPRPNTWLAKIRFRPDGKPRSKQIALGFGSLILFNLTLLYNLTNEIEKGETTQKFLAQIIQFQHMDNTTYDSVDFGDFMSTLSYYKKFDQIFTQSSEEEADQKYENILYLLKRMTERGSENSQAQVQKIMRSAAEKIHGAFRESKRDSFLNAALSVIQVIIHANISLHRLTLDWLKEEVKYHQTSLEAIRKDELTKES